MQPDPALVETYRGMDDRAALALLEAFGDARELAASLARTAAAFGIDPADLDHALRTVRRATLRRPASPARERALA